MINGYIRVSTRGQLDNNSVEDQRQKILLQYPTAEIKIEAQSSVQNRPTFNALLDNLTEGDVLIVCKLDRLCRTTKEGLQYIDKLINRGVKIHILDMGLIDNSAMGRLIVTNLLAFAEFERSMILERMQSGKEIARQNLNFWEGRPRKYTSKQLEHALELLEGYSYSQVTELTGISKSTLVRAKMAVKQLKT